MVGVRVKWYRIMWLRQDSDHDLMSPIDFKHNLMIYKTSKMSGLCVRSAQHSFYYHKAENIEWNDSGWFWLNGSTPYCDCEWEKVCAATLHEHCKK